MEPGFDAVWPVAILLAALLAIFVLRGKRRFQQFLSAVQVITLTDVVSEHLGNARPIYVYLPPDYPANTGQSYPVLYLNDGQDREALRLHEALARLTQAGRIRPIVAVAIPANEDRLHEYGTAVAPNAQGLGTRAAAYGNFVMEEVRPLIEERFRVGRGVFFLGASLGGLSAFDIAWNHPESFDGVGVFSGSFWWRAATDETRTAPGERIAHATARTSEYRPGFRFWFQAGTRDEVSDRDGNGVIDAIQDTRELIDELTCLGYEEGRDVTYVEVPGGRHDWETWAGVLPDFLVWAFGPTTATRPGLPAAWPSSVPGRRR